MGNRRKSIQRDEFVGNYTIALREELLAVIGAYRQRLLGKDDLRVYAAMLERRALHAKSRVGLCRIVNAQRSVAHGLSRHRIEGIERSLEGLMAAVPQGGKKVAVSRRMVQYIARGRATCSEAVVLLFYCVRRLKQRRRLDCLREEERYARFRYQVLSELSGCGRATLCRAVARLRQRGYLQTLKVQKLNENAYGCLFVDGPLVSMTSQAGRVARSAPKATTAVPVSDNAPRLIPTTPRNMDPKTWIQNRRGVVLELEKRDGVSMASTVRPRRASTQEFVRIQERARQMREAWADAVA